MRILSIPALLALLLALLMASASAVQAAEPTFVKREATGEAAILNGNKQKAFDDAKLQAMREAVAQVAGTIVSSDTLTQNSQLISDRIYANSSGYVRNVEILSQKEEGGVMKVALRAEVGTAELDKDLQAVKALIARFGHPKLVIITQEHAIDVHGVVNSSEVMNAVLSEGFRNDGWTLIDPNFAAGKLRLAAGVALGTPEAKEIGQLSKAEYVLYGVANFRYQPTSGPMDLAGVYLVSGEYDFTLFATDSGSQIGKITGKVDPGALAQNKKMKLLISYEQTMHDASKLEGVKVVAEMRSKVIESLRAAEQNGGRLVLSASGLPDFGAAQAFKRVLEEQSGVREANRKEFASGKAQYELLFVGKAEDLAELLEGKKFKGQKISVTGVTNGTLELSIGK